MHLDFCGKTINEGIDEYVMNFYLFGKADSLCCANWALKRTAID